MVLVRITVIMATLVVVVLVVKVVLVVALVGCRVVVEDLVVRMAETTDKNAASVVNFIGNILWNHGKRKLSTKYILQKRVLNFWSTTTYAIYFSSLRLTTQDRYNGPHSQQLTFCSKPF